MKLTTKSEYSLLLVISLARRQNLPPINLEKLCEENDVPYKYAEHLFSILKRAGIVKARRGSSGGYILGRSPEKISVAEIIRLMDGALAPTEAVSRYFYSHTPIEKEKKLMAVFKDIRDYIANKLEKMTIKDLL